MKIEKQRNLRSNTVRHENIPTPFVRTLRLIETFIPVGHRVVEGTKPPRGERHYHDRQHADNSERPQGHFDYDFHFEPTVLPKRLVRQYSLSHRPDGGLAK